MLPYLSFGFGVLMAIIAAIFGTERWMRTREKKEDKIDHQQQLSEMALKQQQMVSELSLKHQDALMEATRQLQHQRLEERITGMEHRIDEMRGKASEYNNGLNTRIGNMEMKQVEFHAQIKGQIRELYRQHGRRRGNDVPENPS